MRCAVLFFVAFSLCIPNAEAQKKTSKNAWTFEKDADKISDSTRCFFTSPLGGKLAISFQARAVYLTSADMLALKDGGKLKVRVDKNPPIQMDTRNVAPNIAAVTLTPLTDQLLDEMRKGKTLFARVASEVSVVEQEYRLLGAAAAIPMYRACAEEVYKEKQ